MHITHIKWFGVITGIILLSMTSTAHAAGANSTVTVSMTDQFGTAITDRTPQMSVGDCDVHDIVSVAATGTAGTYTATLAWQGVADKTCTFTVGARGFVGSMSLPVTLAVGEGKIITQPFSLQYNLAVTAFDDTDHSVTSALVTMGGEQARVINNNTYYFAAPRTGALAVNDYGLLVSSVNTALANLTLSTDSVTNVRLQGTMPCTNESMNMTCSALSSAMRLTVLDQNGMGVTGALVDVYLDPAFTVRAKSGLASGTGGVSFPLGKGTYYVQVSANGFTDYLGTFTSGMSEFSKTFTLKRLSGSIPNPHTSRFQVVGSPVASGSSVTQLLIDVVGGDTAQTRLQNFPFTVISSRGSLDTITYPMTMTNGSGLGTAYITTETPGTAVFLVITSEGLLGTQTVTFLAPPTVSGVPASATRSLLSTTPSPILADGKEQVTVTVIAKTANGAPLQGALVTFKSNRPEDVLTEAGATNDKGMASVIFTTTKPGTAWISATLGTVPLTDIAVISVSPVVQ